MNPRSPLGRHQIERLGELRRLGLLTDESLSTRLRELGQPCSRGSVSRYYTGLRAAPLGLLDLLLGHCDESERVAVLSLWAEPFGLVVLPRELGPQERWQLHLLSAELQRHAGRLHELAGPAPLRRAA
jgi:hypothetical protein